MTIPQRLRHCLLSAMALFYRTAGWVPAALCKNRVQFLYLHHIHQGGGDDFRNLLRTLLVEHHPASYSTAAAMITGEDIDRPYITVSFDDGFKSCLQAAQIMDEFGIKGCFFICPSIIGEADQSKVREFCLRRLHTLPREFMSWDDIDRLLRSGHEIGTHTLTHPNLALLSPSEVRDEVEGSYEMLKRKIGDVRHFAWPFGRFRHFSPTAAQIVYATGYATCASAERGCHITQTITDHSELCIRRDHVAAGWPTQHILYFLAKASLGADAEMCQWPTGWRGLSGG